MKRTEKSKPNSRQKSKANSRQDKSIANRRQSKPKDCDRYKAKYEERHLTEKAAASQSRSIQEPMQMSSRGNKS